MHQGSNLPTDTGLDLAGGAGAVGRYQITCRALLSGAERFPPTLSHGLHRVGVGRAMCPSDGTQILTFTVISKCGFTDYGKNTLTGLRDRTLQPLSKSAPLSSSLGMSSPRTCPRVLSGMGSINRGNWVPPPPLLRPAAPPPMCTKVHSASAGRRPRAQAQGSCPVQMTV